ncbi:hypothetical protein HON71_01430 [Candidatus Woesearchaeota archaeon]|nr:hypothetical protein [Candidatus Woesearchaeota archaeon]MBT5342782.1 hypothetical protein [Candidatus Woesearchaeota archaeon]
MKKIILLLSLLVVAMFLVSCTPADGEEGAALTGEAYGSSLRFKVFPYFVDIQGFDMGKTLSPGKEYTGKSACRNILGYSNCIAEEWEFERIIYQDENCQGVPLNVDTFTRLMDCTEKFDIEKTDSESCSNGPSGEATSEKITKKLRGLVCAK